MLAFASFAPSAFAVFPGENGLIAYSTHSGSPGSSPEIHTVLPSGHGDRLLGQGLGPQWSPNGRRIAFIIGQGLATNIATMRADGSDVRQLTFDSANSTESYSPGGGRLVFLHGSSAVVMRNDGSQRHPIAKDLGDVTWSPSGEIAYRAGDHGQVLGAMRPDGTDKHRLVTLGDDGGFGPIYSPDGSKFMFGRYWNDGTQELRLADADGSNVRRVRCQNALLSPSTTPFGRGHIPLTYSPDGRWALVVASGASSENLRRVSLGSCTGETVVGGLDSISPDWQPVVAP
jgi:Tol biopolymer transport system component